MPDFGRPDFGRPDSGRPDSGRSSEPSLDEIRRSDDFLDALAGGRIVAPRDAADAELAALLGRWRDETRWPPATGLISESDAIDALTAGRSQRRTGAGRERWDPDTDTTPRRRPRGLSVIGASAAAVLAIGGFGAVVAGAGPGDGLYGLRTMLFGAPKEVRDDQVALAARTQLNQVQDLISRGDWQQAQDKLVEVSTQVASIGDQQQKQDLLETFNNLSAKVVERDPAATAPPGVVYTVPPSAAELVPAVAPTSTPSAPPLSESATSTTDTASETAGATSETPVPESESATSAEADTPSPAAESAAESAASSADPAVQSEPTTTPTSAAPSATTDLQESAAVATTTAAVESSAAATAQSGPPGSAESVPPPDQSPAGTLDSPEEIIITTTVVIPVPAG